MTGLEVIRQFSRETGICEMNVSAAATRIFPGIFRPRIHPRFTERLAHQLRRELQKYLQKEEEHV